MTDTQTPDTGTEEIITPTNDENNGTSTVPPATPEGEVPTDPVVPPVETPVDPPTPPVVPPVDYKKKFSESTRQSQIIADQYKNLQKVLGDITKQEVPTEAEMRELEPEWDYLSDREKSIVIRQEFQDRRLNNITKTISDNALEMENTTKLQSFITNEPRLFGKEDDFYAYATKPANHGASMEILLGAFLFEVGAVPPPTPTPQDTPPVDNNPPSLMRGSPRAGNPPSAGQDKYSDEELKALRTKDPKTYFKLIRDKKI